MFIQRFPLFVLGVATLFSQAGPVFGAAVHGSQNDESGGGTGRGGGAGRLVSSCVVDKTIAMTFDDGPSESLRQLVDLMQASDAKGTIFISKSLLALYLIIMMVVLILLFRWEELWMHVR